MQQHNLKGVEAFTHVPLSSERIGYDPSLDGIRLVATLMVLLIHISGKGFPAMVDHWWAVNVYESVSRICVPLFFMLTGALLLPRKNTVTNVLARVWRVSLALFAWSFIYLIYYKAKGVEFDGWLLLILKKPVAGHLWYLYTLIGAYFFIPVLSSFFVNSSVRLQSLVLFVWFVASSLLPVANRFADAPFFGIDLSFFYIYPAYILAGALIYSHLKVTRGLLMLCFAFWGVSILLTALLTWYFFKGLQVNNETFYEYFSPFVVVGALSAFICIRCLSSYLCGFNGFVRKAIVFFGSSSFGVYLVHPLIIWTFENHGVDWHFINPWLAIPLMLAGVFSVSVFMVMCIKSIPYIRGIIP
jgi:surface polysaccharide O-acyltransferase-like enzyme